MTIKIGRNDQCPCGSGKKYKRCHLYSGGFPVVTKIEPTAELEAIRQEMMNKETEKMQRLASFGVFINFITPIQFKGRKVWALGSRLYPTQPENQTFHEFIVYVLMHELGRGWWDEQSQLPEDQRHFVFRCFQKHFEWKDKNSISQNKYGKLWRAKPDGYSRALISLAFDICSLLHAVHLPGTFLNRLRKRSDYQGVRYEIAIAALFARMGYEINFLDEEVLGQVQQPKHPEFIATNPITREEIAVEVKSKEREGVLHAEGQFIQEKEFRSGVSTLFRHAMEQKPSDKPFIVFIDMNLPLSAGLSPNKIPWVKLVTDMRDRATFFTKGQPTDANAVVFTNYSYHYGTDKETSSGEWLLEKSGNPIFPIQSPDFGEKFISVLQRYGNVPNIDEKIET